MTTIYPISTPFGVRTWVRLDAARKSLSSILRCRPTSSPRTSGPKAGDANLSPCTPLTRRREEVEEVEAAGLVRSVPEHPLGGLGSND